MLGSIPFGYILTKIFLNKDIRNIGSGNIGATNVLRTGNKSIGYATLILDLSKAIDRYFEILNCYSYGIKVTKEWFANASGIFEGEQEIFSKIVDALEGTDER